MKRISILLLAALLSGSLSYTSVEKIKVHSNRMGRDQGVTVVIPSGENLKGLPVVYLLHVAFNDSRFYFEGIFKDRLIEKLADKYRMIIVLPDCDNFSFYLDSPVNPESQFETYIIKELIPFIDSKYPTAGKPLKRFITGGSMGGHGSLYLGIRNSGFFGGISAFMGMYDLNVDEVKNNKGLNGAFKTILGAIEKTPGNYSNNSVINLDEFLIGFTKPLFFEIGYNDYKYLIEGNRKLHQKLIRLNIDHIYRELNGKHNGEFVHHVLEDHFRFFSEILHREI